MHFSTKSHLKITRNHTDKHALNVIRQMILSLKIKNNPYPNT